MVTPHTSKTFADSVNVDIAIIYISNRLSGGMRDRIIASLGEVRRPRFLVYVMGPYKAFDIDAVIDGTDTTEGLHPAHIPDSLDFTTLVESASDQHDVVFDLLLDVRDRLRTDPGVNAFLAVDIDIPLAELDAATQSIEFAFASNAVVYIIPRVGDNLGVGIEVGAVLEAIYRQREDRDEDAHAACHHERVLFIHESGVRSAMIAGILDRWDARVYSYTGREDLVTQVRVFLRDVARREQYGELPRLDYTCQ